MSQTNDKSDRGIESTTVSTEVQETLVDEVLSAARKYNTSGQASVEVIVDADTGEVVWKGRLGAGECPAYEYEGITISLSASDSFCSRDTLNSLLSQKYTGFMQIKLE